MAIASAVAGVAADTAAIGMIIAAAIRPVVRRRLIVIVCPSFPPPPLGGCSLLFAGSAQPGCSRTEHSLPVDGRDRHRSGHSSTTGGVVALAAGYSNACPSSG
ncbi:unannotated protein [freshwater metagenome]|uniref:Unannotated protein n=1 Tax=freshwater metagenome TaxID=449393 RepID=A0A6J7J9Q0_9ZZZZ